jgi:hypothetical protein
LLRRRIASCPAPARPPPPSRPVPLPSSESDSRGCCSCCRYNSNRSAMSRTNTPTPTLQRPRAACPRCGPAGRPMQHQSGSGPPPLALAVVDDGAECVLFAARTSWRLICNAAAAGHNSRPFEESGFHSHSLTVMNCVTVSHSLGYG